MTPVPNNGANLFTGCQFVTGTPFFSQQAQSFFVESGILNGTANDVPNLKIDQTTGQVSIVGTTSPSSGTNPNNVAIDPFRRYVYVSGGTGANFISGYSLEPTTGNLTPLSTPAYATLSQPSTLVIDGLGKHLCTTYNNTNKVSCFAIGTGGLLGSRNDYTAGTGAGTGQPLISPNGAVLSVINYTDPTINTYQIVGDGTLIPRNSYSVGSVTIAGTTIFDPTSACLYVGDNGGSGGNGIWQFSVDSNGTLHRSTPNSNNNGNVDGYVAMSPDNKYFIWGEHAGPGQGYGVYTEQVSTCTLTPVLNSPFYVGAEVAGLSFTRSGNFGVTYSLNNNVLITVSYDSATGTIAPVDSASTGTSYTTSDLLISIPQP